MLNNERLIALVDDEEDILTLEAGILKREGYQTRSFTEGDSFLRALEREKPQYTLILLDVMLPGISGTDILRSLRNSETLSAYRKVPVIMVSARDTETDTVVGLELGADDYIGKPFGASELAARVKAVLRRSSLNSGEGEGGILRLGGIVLDEKRASVSCDGEIVELTGAEYRILQILMTRKGWVFDRNRILDVIWKGEKNVTDRTVDVHIKHLREKLGRWGDCVQTVRGLGYKIDDSGE
jgi:DNA-binding response OmpR family regulator